ncbi:MAG TPA: serine acetyltransferase [Phycisphaerae bacterium]|nr:serine acetyltransferase [Phycisphaerae bacterium]
MQPKKPVQPLVQAIVDSYNAEPRTRHIDAGHLPNRDAIIELLKLIRELLFPGYFGKQNLTAEMLNYHVGELLAIIQDKLFQQVRNAIRHQATRRGAECPTCDDTAEAIVREFLGTIPQLRATLATDVQAAFDGDPAAADTDEIIFSYPGLFAITIYRIAHELHKQQVPLIPRIMTEYAHNLTGIDIHPGATIGEFFFIDHGTGVVIGETTTIGQHVKLYQGVTLGALSTRGGQTLRGAKRHPTLEDDVTVYSGTSVLGGETIIGKGAIIAGNVFLTQSVPPHTRVSMKNPELQYRNRPPRELKQEPPPLDFQI